MIVFYFQYCLSCGVVLEPCSPWFDHRYDYTVSLDSCQTSLSLLCSLACLQISLQICSRAAAPLVSSPSLSLLYPLSWLRLLSYHSPDLVFFSPLSSLHIFPPLCLDRVHSSSSLFLSSEEIFVCFAFFSPLYPFCCLPLFD